MVVKSIAARLMSKRPAIARSTVVLIVAAALMLAGCKDDRQSQAKRATPFDLPAGQCLSMLTDRGVTFESLAPVGNDDGCGIETPVALSAMTAALSRPARMGCPLAIRFEDFERRVLQPLAIRYFGQPVKRIHHYGAYACRNQRGGNDRLISQHALGRAIDVAAFELADGTVIRVKQDWSGIGRRSRFLRNIAREACELFHIVLTPNHDRAHRDHLHFDIGPWRRCTA